jgi:hypothetical protein
VIAIEWLEAREDLSVQVMTSDCKSYSKLLAVPRIVALKRSPLYHTVTPSPTDHLLDQLVPRSFTFLNPTGGPTFYATCKQTQSCRRTCAGLGGGSGDGPPRGRRARVSVP